MKRTIQILTMILLCLSFTTIVSAQSKGDVKVDELPEAKIRQFMKQAESIGYTDAQIEQMAMAQGMSAEEAAKLKLRVEQIRKADAAAGGTDNTPKKNVKDRNIKEEDMDDPLDPRRSSLTKKELDTLKKPIKPGNLESMKLAFEEFKPKIFGAQLFKNEEITFEPNLRLATPKNYIVGPDDELFIDLSGDNELTNPYRLKVTPEGNIRIPLIGSVSVGGLSIEQATSRIRSAMSGIYAAIRSGRTAVNVTLGNVRSIKVIINGQVSTPGTYTLSSLSSVYSALHASGGPSENGSFRKIQLIRNNKIISTIDVYDFLLGGISKGNLILQDQDVINIPVYTTRVEVVGEVKTPALFEILPGESFNDLLNFAGGFSAVAYKAKIKVFQNTDKERRITDIMAGNFGGYKPGNGDKFFVEPILDRFENRVELKGAVFRGGFYSLESGLTVSGLIKKADGLKEEAFMNRANITRLNPDNSTSSLSFDLGKVMAGTAEDILLQREDIIVISSIFDLREEFKVSIDGEIRNPGTFDYAENMSLEDLIQKAGGFKESATPTRINISRRTKNSDAQSASASTAEVFTVNVDQNLKITGDKFVLMPFDIVSVRSSTSYQVQKQIVITGEVLFPGTYTITRRDERISDIIKRAGGLSVTAYADGAFLKRTGSVKVKQEEDEKFLALQRLYKSRLQKDTLNKTDSLKKAISSDLVGINLTKILKEPGSRLDLILEEGDTVTVPKQLQTIKVSGEVLNPNNIVFSPGKSLKQYINGAGGFSSNALRSGVFIKYANGSVDAARQFLFFKNYPKVKPGAEILVPIKQAKKPMDAQAWIGIGTAIASLGAILVTLLK